MILLELQHRFCGKISIRFWSFSDVEGQARISVVVWWLGNFRLSNIQLYQEIPHWNLGPWKYFVTPRKSLRPWALYIGHQKVSWMLLLLICWETFYVKNRLVKNASNKARRTTGNPLLAPAESHIWELPRRKEQVNLPGSWPTSVYGFFNYESVQWMISHLLSAMCIYYMGVSLNGGTPKTPQNDHF